MLRSFSNLVKEVVKLRGLVLVDAEVEWKAYSLLLDEHSIVDV